MNQSNTTAPIASRTDDIAAFLSDAARATLEALDDAADKRKAASDAAGDATNKREVLMGAIAAKSLAESWVKSEVDAALTVAVSRINNDATKKTFATLKSEIQHAAHDVVRRVFHDLVRIRDVVWEEEGRAIKEAKANDTTAATPVRDKYKRSYHALTAMMRRVANPPRDAVVNPFVGPADLTDYAVAALDEDAPKRLAAAFQRMLAEMEAFHAKYPIEPATTLIEYAREFTIEELQAKMERHLAAQRDAATRKALEDAGVLGDLDGVNGPDTTGESTQEIAAPEPAPEPAPHATTSVVDDAMLDSLLAA